MKINQKIQLKIIKIKKTSQNIFKKYINKP